MEASYNITDKLIAPSLGTFCFENNEINKTCYFLHTMKTAEFKE